MENLPESSYIVVEMETTGLSPKEGEILQLTIIDADGNVLFDSMLMPQREVAWEELEKLIDVSYEMVKSCPTIDDVKKEIQAILKKADTIAGYNTGFAVRFLEAAGFNVPEIQYDLAIDFAPIYGMWSAEKNDWIRTQFSNCANFFGYGVAKPIPLLEEAKAILFCIQSLKELKQTEEYNRIVEENVNKKARK